MLDNKIMIPRVGEKWCTNNRALSEKHGKTQDWCQISLLIQLIESFM